MLYEKKDKTPIYFYAQTDMKSYWEKDDGSLFINKEYLPQKIINQVEAMIRGEVGYEVV